jgi:hypothetical protein
MLNFIFSFDLFNFKLPLKFLNFYFAFSNSGKTLKIQHIEGKILICTKLHRYRSYWCYDLYKVLVALLYIFLMIGGYQGIQERDNDPNNTTASQYSFLCSLVSNKRCFHWLKTLIWIHWLLNPFFDPPSLIRNWLVYMRII